MSATKVRRYTDLPTDLESALDMIEKLLDREKDADRIQFETARALEVARTMIQDARAALNAIEAPVGMAVRHPLEFAKVLAEEKSNGPC